MLIQSTSLPPDVQYVLDGALDADEINAFDHVVLNLYGSRTTVPEIVDRERPHRQGWRLNRGAIGLELDRHAHEIAADLPEEDRRACFASALIREPARLLSLAEVYAGWNIEDSTVGACLLPHRKRELLGRDDRPTKRLARRLWAPSAIRRYVKVVDDSSLPHAQALARNLRCLPWPRHVDEVDRLGDYFAAQQVRYAEARQRVWTKLLRPAAPKRPERKMMRRSAAAATSVLSSAEVGTFIRGEAVTLATPDILFRVSGRIRSQGHTALNVQMDSLEGERLAGLCLYFDRTPGLDQLAAFALHAQAGDTADLLKIGNPYNVTLAGARHPLIADRLRQIHPEEPADGHVGVYRRVPHEDRRRRMREEYVEATKHLYLRYITERVWGPDAKRIAVYADQIAAAPREQIPEAA